MGKPVAVSALLARIRTQIRRSWPVSLGQRLEYVGIMFDGDTHRGMRAGDEIKLGRTEFRLLNMLMEKPGRVWTREQLLDRVCGRVDSRIVDGHVGRLRKALRKGGGSDPLRIVRSTGYTLGCRRFGRAGRGRDTYRGLTAAAKSPDIKGA